MEKKSKNIFESKIYRDENFKVRKKKIIIFLSQPIDKRNIQRFGYYSLKKKFQVQIWNISGLFNKNINKVYGKKSQIHIDNKNYVEVNSYFQVLKLIKNLKKIYFVDCTTYSSILFGLIQKYLVLRGSKKISVTSCFLPAEIHMSKKEKLINILFNKRSNPLIGVMNLMINYILNKLAKFFYPMPNYSFISGLKEKLNYSTKTKIVYSHCFDYDLFLLENKKKNKSKNSNYALFIDNMIFDHPEILISKKYYKDPAEKNYFLDLKRFFYDINKKFNYKIFLAIHPRSNNSYKKKIKNIFKENYFKIVEDNTAKFIKKSKLVISHNSSAIQFAILWKKPIIFCHHSKMQSYIKKYITGLSSALKKRSYDIQTVKFSILKKDFQVIDKNYNNYIKNYIQSSKSSKLSTWEKFYETLKK